MSAENGLEYTPDYAVPPGETLLETIEVLGMSQAELATRTGRPLKTINEIIKGKASITPETALQLERVLRVPAKFWSSLERSYRETLARQEEQDRLKGQEAWLRKIPFRAMIKMGWIRSHKDKVQQIKEVLGFFGVASPEQWEALWKVERINFRQSAVFQSDPGAVSAWLRKGELDAHQIDCRPYNETQFLEALRYIRALTKEPPKIFQPEVMRICADAGVAVVFVPELPKLRVSGATRWLSPKKALIQLSLRYKTDDHLWFAFFHEGCHVLKHGKREVFLEDDGPDDAKEQEANRFAANIVIPPADYRQFARRVRFSKAEIGRFAAAIGIAPGIVVGRLQHDGKLPRTQCNGLKRRFKWAESDE
jgi:HTH-type transcriptional regulator/antitoxin HigA